MMQCFFTFFWVLVSICLLVSIGLIGMVVLYYDKYKECNELKKSIYVLHEHVRDSNKEFKTVFNRLSHFIIFISEELRMGHIRIEDTIKKDIYELREIILSKEKEGFEYDRCNDK